ncbi:MAG: hypothetical protein KGM44_12725 [bacterium]|nr:hypothetical protein [bacterium]
MESRIEVAGVHDLRSTAGGGYEPAQRLPKGVTSLYGADAPFGSAAFARRDAREIAPSCALPAAQAIPGSRVQGSLRPAERFVLRIPERWNGRLVVAGTPSQRSEFACDLIFGDPLVARGYAYVCGNKGLGDGTAMVAPGAALCIDGARLPRLELPGGLGLCFWQHAPRQRLEGWLEDFLAIARCAQATIRELRGRAPELTYAVGFSNGGYQVRRAIEESDLFSGALTWNAALWTPRHNLLRQLPQAIEAMERGDPEQLPALGFPADVRGLSGGALYQRYLTVYWRVSAWLHAMHLDPETSLAYGDVTDAAAAEAWSGRMGSWRFDRSPLVAARVGGFANTGRIRTKLIEVAATHDYLIPPAMHLEPYRAMVAAAGLGWSYRCLLIDHAQHVDRWSDDPDFPQMRVAHPRVLALFRALVDWVERGREPRIAADAGR